jgi:hypothetical protein
MRGRGEGDGEVRAGVGPILLAQEFLERGARRDPEPLVSGRSRVAATTLVVVPCLSKAKPPRAVPFSPENPLTLEEERRKHALIVTPPGPRRQGRALPAEVAMLQRPPRRARRNFDQSAVERLLERRIRRQRERHVGGGEYAARHRDDPGEIRRDRVLQSAYAIDDDVGLAAHQRSQRGSTE